MKMLKRLVGVVVLASVGGIAAGGERAGAATADMSSAVDAFGDPCANVPRGCGKIAFVSDRGGNRDIYSVDVDGARLTRLTTAPEYDIDPKWSPDGLRIAFTTLSGDISWVSADGTVKGLIVNDGWNPSWRR
jgi:hypothetical protein